MTTQPYDWFLATARRHPYRLALDVAGLELTYAELRVLAERVSARMCQTLGRVPRRVGLLTTRTPATYAAFLAAHRLGATTVALDPSIPAVRNVDITGEAGLDLTVVDDSAGDGVAEYCRRATVPVLDLRGDGGLNYSSPVTEIPPRVRRTEDDFAYITFTSGTTGRPKGVPTTVGNVSVFVEHTIRAHRFTRDSRVAQAFEQFADGSIMDMLCAWGVGASLHVPQRPEVFAPARFVNEKRLTHWGSMPAIISFARRLRGLQPGSMPTLRWACFGGEALTVENARAWAAAAPNCTVTNVYGPTEATIAMTGCALPTDPSLWPETSNGTVPIGVPYPHVDWVLLDGELCVRGSQRFPGYLDPSHNVGRFVSLDGGPARVYTGAEPLTPAHYYRTGDHCRLEHGQLVHCGRLDGRVKIRSNLVEPSQVESTLREHPAVVELVVVPVKAADGELDLHAFYTGEQVPDTEFVTLLRDVPWYCHPRGFHHRPFLPLNPMGKINRKALATDLTSR